MKTLLLLLSMNSFAADPNKPHPHQGKATVFTSPQKTILSPTQIQTIKSGKPILKQVQKGEGGRGIAIWISMEQKKPFGM